MARLFKIRNKSKSEISQSFVGVQIPNEYISYLALYSIEKGISRSYLIREAIRQHIRLFTSDLPLLRLKQKVIVILRNEWKKRNSIDEILYARFKTEAKAELIKKGVDQQMAEDIINEL